MLRGVTGALARAAERVCSLDARLAALGLSARLGLRLAPLRVEVRLGSRFAAWLGSGRLAVLGVLRLGARLFVLRVSARLVAPLRARFAARFALGAPAGVYRPPAELALTPERPLNSAALPEAAAMAGRPRFTDANCERLAPERVRNCS